MMRTAILPLLALFAFATAQGPVNATGKLAVGQAAVKRGEAVKATIILEIPSGHHAYAPVGESDFIPVTVEGIKGSSYTVKAYFPKGDSKTYPGLDHAVMAYEGKVSIPVKFFIPANHKTGKLVVKAVVGSQVCSNQTGVCYAPKRQMVTGTVTVK
jgi:DsbC/DsbD-like thiol-disulfide interchange protein